MVKQVFDILPQLIVIVAIVAIIVIVARKAPKTAEIPKGTAIKKSRSIGKIKKAFALVWEQVRKVGMAVFGQLSSKIKEVKEKSQVVKEKKDEKELLKLAMKKPLVAETATSATADEIIDLIEEASGYFGKGNLEKAEKLYIDIITKDPKNVRAYKGLGKIYKRQRNFKDAKASFEQVLKIEPDDREVKEELDEIKKMQK